MIHKLKNETVKQSEGKNEENPAITIKKEKTEDRVLHPMSYYTDDCLEMVKQVFGTLKSKTIRNLAPEHIKGESMEVIQEQVLNELMCISTKRLRAIINDTRCPTDTETSDDSDVEHKRQHVSLEEISSDSDIDAAGSRKVRKTKTKYNQTNSVADKKEKNDDKSQISILELLELQARARAIRSQLAMEPVTKIEVDSDDNTKELANGVTKRKQSPRTTSLSRPSIQIETEMESNGVDCPVDVTENEGKEKRIKLKRRYRNKADTEVSTDQKTEDCKQTEKRALSPDVIPIVPEPEVLVIDSTDDEQVNKAKKHENEKTTSEAEEGEILDENGSSIEKNKKLNDDMKEEIHKEVENSAITSSSIKPITPLENCAEQETQKCNEISADKIDTSEDPGNEKNIAVKCQQIDDNNIKCEENTAKTFLANKSDEDDVISLEGGDLEMIDLDESTQSTIKSKISDNNEIDDVMILHSSSDESSKISSWSDRYLKSAKVAKVLKTSHLSRKVREKLKADKLEKKLQKKDIEEKATKKAQ